MCVFTGVQKRQTDGQTERDGQRLRAPWKTLQNFVLPVNLQKRVIIVLKSFSGLNAHFQVSVVHFSLFFMVFLRTCAVKEM